jgi:hypothetical protein
LLENNWEKIPHRLAREGLSEEGPHQKGPKLSMRKCRSEYVRSKAKVGETLREVTSLSRKQQRNTVAVSQLQACLWNICLELHLQVIGSSRGLWPVVRGYKGPVASWL